MEPKFTVFEVVNDHLQEIYVGFTDHPIFRIASDPAAASSVAHWAPEDAKSVRSIEFGLTEPEARRFIENYTRTPLPPDWRFLTGAL